MSFVKFWSVRSAVILSCVVLFVVSIFLVVNRPSSDVSQIYDDLISCPATLKSGQTDSDPGVICRIDVMSAAFEKYGPNTPALALDALTTDFPEYWYQCHYELHRAGESIASKINVGEYIGEMTNNTCHSGIIHGIFDYIGKNSTDGVPIEETVKICDSVFESLTKSPTSGSNLGLVYSECTHSIGHASWLLEGDFENSLP